LVDSYPSNPEEINRGLMPNAHYLSTLQVRLGHQVTVYAMRNPPQPRRQTLEGVSIVRVDKPRLRRTFLGLRISKLIRRSGGSPDIVHAMNPLPIGWLHKRIRRILSAKYVMSVHGSVGDRKGKGGWPTPQRLYVEEYRRLVTAIAKDVDLVLPVSAILRRELIGRGVDPERLRVIPSGVETKVFAPREEEHNEVPRILYVGRFSKGKGLKYLLDALALLRKRCEAEATLVGGTPLDDGYEEVLSQVSRLGLNRAVRLLQPVGHFTLPSLYSSHDFLVLPSENEALGKVLLEAMACGRPVIATRVGGIPDIVAEGRNGLLVPPRDAESLAQAIEGLSADEGRRRRMGIIARKWALNFDWSRIAERYNEAFESLL